MSESKMTKTAVNFDTNHRIHIGLAVTDLARAIRYYQILFDVRPTKERTGYARFEVADDLLQDVFVRIHNRLSTLDDEDRLSAWVFRIARNAVTDHYRRRTTAELEDSEISEDELSDDVNINAQVGKWIVDLIAELPDEYREAVTLSEVQGVRQTEIAKMIGLSDSGAKSRVQRGRKMLKDSLLRCCHFDFDRRGNVIDYRANTQCERCCRTKNEGGDG